MELIRKTGPFAPAVKHTVHPERTIVEYAKDVFDVWTIIVHGRWFEREIFMFFAQ